MMVVLKRFIKIFSRNEWLLLLGACIGALFLGVYPLLSQYTFGYDQARDAFEAYNIWHNHDIKIIGPSTDFVGVFHGVLWFYLLAILYGIGNGNPDIVSLVYFILLFLTVPLVGWVAYLILKDKSVSLIAMVLYSFSPLFQAFSRWFSNPVLSLFVMPFLLVMLWKFINTQHKKYAFWIGFCYGLVIQSNFGYALLLLLIPLYWFVFRIRLSLSHILFFLFGSIITLSTFIIAEIKFQGRATISVINFFLAPHTSSKSFSGLVTALLDKMAELLYLTVFPFPKLVILFLTVITIFFIRNKIKEKEIKGVLFLLLWLINILLYRIFNTGLTTSAFVFAPSIIVVCILFSYLLNRITNNKIILSLAVISIVIMQVLTIQSWIKINKTALSVQQGLSYKDEKKVIDYTYMQSNGKQFTINTVTNPLFINVLWAYIYKFYGNKEYGYLPFWDGKNQTGYLGNDVFKTKVYDTEFRYLIIEPDAGIPQIYITKEIYTEDTFSDIIAEQKFGNFVVQKRKYHPNKPRIATPAALLKSNILYE
jgi:hypothetical protein